ncbi:MAG: hypothetical protein ACTSRZ_17965 [Promethearchaeota archaeon]
MSFKNIKELEAEIGEALSCQEVNTEKYVSDRSKIINILKDVLRLIDEINTKSASGRERAPVLVLEELKSKIEG